MLKILRNELYSKGSYCSTETMVAVGFGLALDFHQYLPFFLFLFPFSSISLPHQSLGLHVLGEEAVVADPESSVAGGHAAGCTGGHLAHRRDCHPRHNRGHPHLHGAQGGCTDLQRDTYSTYMQREKSYTHTHTHTLYFFISIIQSKKGTWWLKNNS